MKLPFKYTVIMKITILTEKDLEKHVSTKYFSVKIVIFMITISQSRRNIAGRVNGL